MRSFFLTKVCHSFSSNEIQVIIMQMMLLVTEKRIYISSHHFNVLKSTINNFLSILIAVSFVVRSEANFLMPSEWRNIFRSAMRNSHSGR